jgi:L-xylulokinase
MRGGHPAYNGIISTDNRAWQYPEKWKLDGVFDSQYPKLCQQLMACQQISLLAWMKDHDRQVFDSIERVFSVKDYIRFKLTGEAWSEATDISGSGLMNVRDAKFDRDMLGAFGLEEVYDMLAPLRYSSDICGEVTAEAARLTGLAEGTPVARGMFDIDACAIAMSIIDPEPLCTITGTWSINEFITERPITGTSVAMNSLYAIPGYYLLEDSSATGAGNLEWIIQNLVQGAPRLSGGKLYDYLDGLVANVPPDKSELYFLPFLYGSNRHPLAKSCFIGLTSFHGMEHMTRAVYEGVVYSAKSHIDKLLSIRTPPKAVRMAGGAANSALWAQMFADVLELPIETVTGVKELGALGCAMAAAVVAGEYRDYGEASGAMVNISAPISPDPKASAIYRGKYEKYSAVCDALDGVWKRFEV